VAAPRPIVAPVAPKPLPGRRPLDESAPAPRPAIPGQRAASGIPLGGAVTEPPPRHRLRLALVLTLLLVIALALVAIWSTTLEGGFASLFQRGSEPTRVAVAPTTAEVSTTPLGSVEPAAAPAPRAAPVAEPAQTDIQPEAEAD